MCVIPRTLRAKFLLIIVAGVAVPLAVVGLWLTGATERSGRTLLHARLATALAQVVYEAGSQWVVVRGALLDVAEDPTVRAALETPKGMVAPALSRVAAPVRADVIGADRAVRLLLRNKEGVAWVFTEAQDSTMRLERDASEGVRGIVVEVPVTSRSTGLVLGTIEAHLPVASLVTAGAAGTGGMGAVLGIADRSTGIWLAPLPFDPSLLDHDEFDWAGERWLVAHRTLEDPRLAFAAAAPLSAYTLPFKGAARQGAIALLIVSVVTLTVAGLLTRHLTHSLERLAVAAEAVSRGDLELRVEAQGSDEVGRVARAFNVMVASVRRTLDQLATRERLAAVGEFAAALAHEVRNPLTSIRVDLQRIQEQLTQESALGIPVERVLREVSRLDRTVAGALRVARSGTSGTDRVDLRIPLERALQVAAPTFDQASARLEPLLGRTSPLVVRGDASALEQLFLNLLLNAAQALPEDGTARVMTSTADGFVEIAIHDSGRGIPEGVMDRVFEPFFSTKSEGTGLGLAVARQIAVAHGGDLLIESAEGIGTIARVRLPLLSRIPDWSAPT